MVFPPSKPDALVRTRVALLSIVLFWLFYFGIVTLRALVMGFEDQGEMLVRRIGVCIAAIFITFLVYLGLRRFLRASFARRVSVAALLAIPAAFAFATVNWLAFYGLHPVKAAKVVIERQDGDKDPTIQVGGAPEKGMDGPVAMIADHAANAYFFMVAWAALFLALCYASEVAAAERRAARYRNEAQTAQLRALRYQINPHFLFNTLNSVSSLILKDNPEQAEQMIMNLSTFFRTSLTADPAEDLPLAEEIRLQRLYLDIEAVRFPERLVVEIDVAASAMTACVPGLILQPLVENAIKYGVSRARRPVTVRISAEERGGTLVLRVEDDADPLPPGDGEQGTGLGLRNVCDRLQTRFGDAASCVWGPTRGQGFAVTLTMPVVRHGC